MTEVATQAMNDAAVMAVHQEYVEKHKKAFRMAFDLLQALWPPKNDPTWFVTVAYPKSAEAYAELHDNPLGMNLILDVFEYLDRMAVKGV